MLLGLIIANGDTIILSGLPADEMLTVVHEYQMSGCRGLLRIPDIPEPNHVVEYCVDSGPWRNLHAYLPANRASTSQDHDSGGSSGGG
jgi:hypothetical protein